MIKKYAKNLSKMMLLLATANAGLSAKAGPPFYSPTRFFASGEIEELAINELSK
tara:strand:+ start:246116 stop:246277 length:162 start_codon:yes stop_codon:yes gene_type:complete